MDRAHVLAQLVEERRLHAEHPEAALQQEEAHHDADRQERRGARPFARAPHAAPDIITPASLAAMVTRSGRSG